MTFFDPSSLPSINLGGLTGIANTVRSHPGGGGGSTAPGTAPGNQPPAAPGAPPAAHTPPQPPAPPAPTTPNPLDPNSQDALSARAILNGALATYGLSSLANTVWEWWKQGRPVDQIFLDLKNTPEYKIRFPAMATLAARGQAISEATYINFEQNAAALWHQAGLPGQMIAQGDYITKWLEGNVSVNEISHRIQDLYVRVSNTAPEVRSWYAQKFNNGDAALAASFADPENAVPVLERQAAAAEFGGAGTRFGYNIDTATGLQAAGLGVSAAGAQQGFQQLQQLNPLFDETVSEQQNLVAEQQGVQAVFGFGQDAQRLLDQRARDREALFAGSTSAGGIQTQRGLGLGVAANIR